MYVSSYNFSNFGSLKSTETPQESRNSVLFHNFSNFGSLKSTETDVSPRTAQRAKQFQQFRLVEEH